ncbi:PREDICTED: angiopoietin-related protein 2-like [Priapulus caudatus]|uniref:Angiopoietin-related protein 2-like n=1 Tax=Priapulus caudatus TaxID=37621 RepID=A0ABM1FA47_PRICU|nr:PREDICTED: angiopoietin-related protein 2-like [Priapulus caudatus]
MHRVWCHPAAVVTVILLTAVAVTTGTGTLSTINSVKVLKNPDYHRVDGKFQDCAELYKHNYTEPGIYVIYPQNYRTKVQCQNGFTIVQQRIKGKVNFQVGWKSYRNGFGSPSGDFWAGLQTIHNLVGAGNTKLLITLQDWNGFTGFALYNYFSIGPESDRYRLSVAGFSGSVTDDFSYHNGMIFATWDKSDYNGCAINQRAGWWYNYCAYALLNGKYYNGGYYPPPGQFFDGMYWKDWFGYNYSLRYISMALMSG